MDPLSTLQTLYTIVKYLMKVSQQLKENGRECEKLCSHTEKVLNIIQQETRGNVSPSLGTKLDELASMLRKISARAEKLATQSQLKRILWRDAISSEIKQAYDGLGSAMTEFTMFTAIDLTHMQQEHEEARRRDSVALLGLLETVKRDDRAIIEHLQVQVQDMREAIMSVQKHLMKPSKLPAEAEFLELGLHAMIRRSGSVDTSASDSMITNLDLIIYHERALGTGGFASVYEADWQGTRVAVKVLEKGVSASAIQQEVNIWKQLRHPNILQFFGACPMAEQPFMVCAFMVNGDANEYLRQNPGVDRRQLLRETARGLAYLHNKNVIHGDIKPTNILVDSSGKPCLSDFGLSRIKTHFTSILKIPSESQKGTAIYMSPEHMEEGFPTFESDIYSFGMTMYEICTGYPPFARTPVELLYRNVKSGVRPPRPVAAGTMARTVDDATWDIIIQAWMQRPQDRLKASALKELLEQKFTVEDTHDMRVLPKTPVQSSPVGSDSDNNEVSLPPEREHESILPQLQLDVRDFDVGGDTRHQYAIDEEDEADPGVSPSENDSSTIRNALSSSSYSDSPSVYSPNTDVPPEFSAPSDTPNAPDFQCVPPVGYSSGGEPEDASVSRQNSEEKKEEAFTGSGVQQAEIHPEVAPHLSHDSKPAQEESLQAGTENPPEPSLPLAPVPAQEAPPPLVPSIPTPVFKQSAHQPTPLPRPSTPSPTPAATRAPVTAAPPAPPRLEKKKSKFLCCCIF